MYFLEKSAVYSHGVFWIGEDLEEGKRKATAAAEGDKDDHHSWDLMEYSEVTNYEGEGLNEPVFSARKVMK